MQVHEFRRELQDAILRLQRIAQKIDDDHLKEVEQNEVDAARNDAVAQARREIAAGVTPTAQPETSKAHHAPEPTAHAAAVHAEPEPIVKHVVVKK